MPRRTATLAFAALVPALAAAGCGGSAASPDRATVTPPTNGSARTSSHMHMSMPVEAPSDPHSGVVFVTPRPDATTGSTLSVRVALRHFHISPTMVGMSPRPGLGHLHFVLDGGRFDVPRYSGPNGVLGAKLGVSGQYSPSLTPSIVYRHLPAGRHTLVVELANNNHTLTGIRAVTHVTVR